MKKRIFSILLALCLAAGLASVPALAVDGEESAETSAEITLETSGEAPVAEAVRGDMPAAEDIALDGDTNYVAQIGANQYETLSEAVAAVADGGTITLLGNSTGDGIATYANPAAGKVAAKSFTIDFAGYTYTLNNNAVGTSGSENQGFHLEELSDGTVPNVTFRNGTINVAVGNTSMWLLIQNYCNLTLENMTVDGTNLGLKPVAYTMSNNHGTVQIKDSTLIAKSGGYAFDVCRFKNFSSVSVTVSGSSVINGKVQVSGTIGEGQSRQLTITGGQFNGNIEVATQPANITITGGTFSSDVSAYLANGYEITQNTEGKWVVEREHTWDGGTVTKPATCTEAGETTYTCTVCEKTRTEPITKLAHTLEHHEAKEATREAEGNIEYWCCDGCGKYYKDPDAVEEITKADTVIAKLAPTPAPTPAPTAKAPPTGDESNLGLWIAILVVCSVLALAVVVIRKKK